MSNEMFKKISSKPVLLFESIDLARTFREWKSPLLSAEFLFIQTFKELASAYKKLLEKEKEFEFYSAEMKNKWERLKTRQTEFIGSIEKYDVFFVENEEKSDRILRKIKLKEEERGKIDEDILDCENRIEYLLKAEVKFENSVQQLTPYKNFLQKITEKMDKFKCVMDLINYYVLMNSETQLLGMLHQTMLDIEKNHTLTIKYLKNKMMVFHEQNNVIFYSNEKCNKKMNSTEELDLKLHHQTILNRNVMTEALILKHSCNNIFLRLIKWKKVKFPRHFDDDAEKKSTFIMETLIELQDAVDLARQLHHKKDTSSQADSSFITARRMI